MAERDAPLIKCVVWDLDGTLWDGVLLEEDVSPRPGAALVIRTLDARGILQSVASRNDREAAMARLEVLGLSDYLLVPQIHWGAKSGSIRAVAEQLNLGLDALAFVDDDAFEREEVGRAHPDVLCLDGSGPLREIVDLPRLSPPFVTDDARRRREMIRQQLSRQAAEERFDGPSPAFLAGLCLRLRIAPAEREDLRRAEELTQRTHQLNSTGITYSYGELDRLRASPDHLLLVADLRDRFGDYGRIGLALVDRRRPDWCLKLLIVSCRVMSRGVGSMLLRDVLCRARDAGARLRAEFRDTGRNRAMRVTYRFAGFQTLEQRGDLVTFGHDLNELPALPAHAEITSVPESLRPRARAERG